MGFVGRPSGVAEIDRREVDRIIGVLSGRPLPLTAEKPLQAEISRLLDDSGIQHRREVELGCGDIVDFMFDGALAMEVKISASRRAIYRQCERYCRHEAVSGLILLTATAIGFPGEIKGKPCWTVSLGAAWL